MDRPHRQRLDELLDREELEELLPPPPPELEELLELDDDELLELDELLDDELLLELEELLDEDDDELLDDELLDDEPLLELDELLDEEDEEPLDEELLELDDEPVEELDEDDAKLELLDELDATPPDDELLVLDPLAAPPPTELEFSVGANGLGPHPARPTANVAAGTPARTNKNSRRSASARSASARLDSRSSCGPFVQSSLRSSTEHLSSYQASERAGSAPPR